MYRSPKPDGLDAVVRAATQNPKPQHPGNLTILQYLRYCLRWVLETQLTLLNPKLSNPIIPPLPRLVFFVLGSGFPSHPTMSPAVQGLGFMD